MQILFLGTAAAEGIPALFCTCATCQTARARGGRNRRTRSSILIDNCLKIDLPPDTLHHTLTYGVDLGALEHLLITHTHADHLALSELQYIEPSFAHRQTALHLYGSSDCVQLVEQLPEATTQRLQLHPLQPFAPYEIADYVVVPILAHHRQDEQCFNYIVSDGQRTALYMCDTGWYREPTWHYLQGVRLDAVIAECTKAFVEATYDTHLSLQEVLQLKQRLREMGTAHAETRWVVTHFSHNGGALHEELEAFCQPQGIEVASDGWLMQL